MINNRDSQTSTRQQFEPRRPGLKFGRIGTRQLSRVCHNVGTALHAGVDIRRVWETEAARGSARQRREMTAIRDRVTEGDGLAASMKAADGYFPPLVCEMVEVGERTGRVEQVFLRLGDHYDHVLAMRRNFLIGIAWPMIELTIGILVMGLMIYVLGMIWSGDGPPPITLFGLYGTRGLMIYSSVIGAIVAAIGFTIIGVQQGLINISPLLRLLMYVPGLGNGLKTLAMSRLTWSLAMATDSDIDPRKAIELAVRTTQNSYYMDHIDDMKQIITGGGEMFDAFARTNAYPDDFLDALQTGEIAGRVSETLAVIAREYEERAKGFYRMLTVAAGVLVFLLVGAVIITMIFALFSQYLGILNDLGA